MARSGEDSFDAVVIGRNEGARLIACLSALIPLARRVVYVDSGSADGSADAARALGVDVVELDPERPFTAARGRNAGFVALTKGRSEFVQFLDGDCLVRQDWPRAALTFLRQTPEAGLAFGRQREADLKASAYNLLTDVEWDSPIGPRTFCAGCVMVRATALEAIGGYREHMIAGEDDDMCLRMQQAGLQTWRIGVEMTEHDARLLSFAPWWRRMLRAGHSFAELGDLHGSAGRAQRVRALFWGGVLPVISLIHLPWSLVGALLLYAVSLGRQTKKFHDRALPARAAIHCATLTMISKFANLCGMALFWWHRMRGHRRALIEYK